MENINKILALINSNLTEIKKIRLERFKQLWMLDINTTKFVFTIEISNVIKLQKEVNHNQYKFDFGQPEEIFSNFESFEKYFLDSLGIIKLDNQTLVASYRGMNYVCEVEVASVDTDRQMGPETIYEVTLIDDDGESVRVAGVSEYPSGAFSVFDKNENVQLSEQAIMRYFYEKPAGWSESNDWNDC